MLRGLGRWFGLRTVGTDGEMLAEDSEPQQDPRTAAQAGTGQQPEDPELLPQGAGLGDYLFNFVSAATKKITKSVAETAQTIKKSVEEGKIDDLIDKTIIGDFQKEQQKFVEEQHTKKCDAAVPPWVDSTDEDTIRQQVLALAADRRNFLRDPPAGAQFHFDLDQMHAVALVMLREDWRLSQTRFALVPKLVKEEVFWRNYFYRVALIKQAAQLTALAMEQQASGQRESGHVGAHSLPQAEAAWPQPLPGVIGSQLQTQEDEEDISTNPGLSEFVSDAFGTCSLNQEDLRKDMEQLVLDKKEEGAATPEGNSEDGEKELQQELQRYELVTEAEKQDENWEKEIEKMLQEVN